MLSSTRKIIEKTAGGSKNKVCPADIKKVHLELPESLQGELLSLQKKYHLPNFNFAEKEMTLLKLRKDFAALSLLGQNIAPKNEDEKATIEKYKLIIIKATKAFFDQHVSNKKVIENVQPLSQKSKFFRSLLFVLLAFFGLFLDGMGTFNFSRVVLSLIPGLSSALLLGLSIGIALINCILFCAFEIGMLKEGLEISFPWQTSDRFKVINEQIDVTEDLNHAFFNVNTAAKIDPAHYQSLARLISSLNQNVADKKNLLNHQERLGKKILRYLLIAFGATMTAAGGYFMADAFLKNSFPMWIGTPWGWAFIALYVISSLGFYWFMQVKSVFYMVNPNFQKAQVVEEKLKNFTIRGLEDFENAVTEKLEKCRLMQRAESEQVERKEGKRSGRPGPTGVDAATQTDESAPTEFEKNAGPGAGAKRSGGLKPSAVDEATRTNETAPAERSKTVSSSWLRRFF